MTFWRRKAVGSSGCPWGPFLAVAILMAAAISDPALAMTLTERIREVESLLVEGKYRAARKRAEPLAEEIAQRAGTKESDHRAVGTAVSLLGLAEAGVGDGDAALWHWAVATQIRPDLASVPLDGYGEAGDRLAELLAAASPPRALPSPDVPEPVTPIPPERWTSGDDPDLDPAKRLRAPAPQATASMRAASADEVLVLRFVLDTDGRLERPEILKSTWPGYAFTTLETMREEWRFSPVKIRGEPVPAVYVMTIEHTADN